MKPKLIAPILLFAAVHLSATGEEVPGNVSGYVDPFIGTTNFGTTNPGAVCPNGLMSVSPFNVMGSSLNVWDKDSRWWSTPYAFENKFFTGYSHVNLSGWIIISTGRNILTNMPNPGIIPISFLHTASGRR